MNSIKKLSLILALSLALGACKVNHLAKVQPQGYRMQPQSTAQPAADPEIEAMIAPYKTELDAEMNQVIGEAAAEMTKAKPEGALGNWMSDLLYEEINELMGEKIDFATVNYGGIRIPAIPKGDITRGKIYELMPFDNMVTVLYVDAETARQFFAKVAEDEGIPISKQVQMQIKDRTLQSVTVNGQPIQDDKIYKIGVSDYVANGGDDCSFFIGKKREDLGVFLRDLIIEHVEEETAAGKKIDAAADGRINIVN